MLQVLLKVADLAGMWNCSRDYIYRRLNPSHPQFIPHKRLPSGDVRFDEQEIVGYLKSSDKQVSFPMSGSSVREGIRMTRNRDRKGSLLLRGRKRKFWLVQWPEGDRRLSHKLGWRGEISASQAERARRQWMEKINSRRDVAGDSVTLDGFFREHYWHEESSQYRDELSTKKPSTRRDMKNAILQVLLPRWGKRSMDSIRTGEIQSFLSGKIGHESGKVSRQTALKWKIYLSSMFTAAIRLEAGITRNPVRGVKLAAAEQEEVPACMSIKQAIEILGKLDDPRHRIAW